MKIIKNIVVPGSHKKPIVTDVFYTENNQPKPILIFCHGYKGFKDWGAWNLMAKAFADAGYFFIKFNFAFNGGSAEQPIDFPDLKAFGQNNYSKELDDLETIINWICTYHEFKNEVDLNSINLIGHSRAGGIVTITAEADNRIKKVVSLAGVSNYSNRYPIAGDVEQWQKDGVKYVENGRTKQQMPHFYQFYEDFIKNAEKLDIKRAISHLNKPYLIIHGDADTSVLIKEAQQLQSWKPDSQFITIEGANHVFGASHPWENTELPNHLKTVIETTLKFLQH
ncbi:alpha/beta hydrolase family protein [Tamlana sp. I1]|uniref:alpha/beta hydrolase family protein n=1 Tax=Tamlana sp. I1 TaxID=2762061 RepID=UPI00188DF643|nr:alpha/beta fold hydrolase [Tamlana sp. I1]